MKVIIQVIGADKFVGENGCWSNDKFDAQDFFSLLRAYHFAQSNISGRFRVLLHCPEDGYVACIIEGVGEAVEQEVAEATFEAPVAKGPRATINEVTLREQIWNSRFDVSKLHLN